MDTVTLIAIVTVAVLWIVSYLYRSDWIGAALFVTGIGILVAVAVNISSRHYGGVPESTPLTPRRSASEIATVATIAKLHSIDSRQLAAIINSPDTVKMLDAVAAAKAMLPPEKSQHVSTQVQYQYTAVSDIMTRANIELGVKSIIGTGVDLGTLGSGEALADLLFLAYSSTTFIYSISQLSSAIVSFARQPASLQTFAASAMNTINPMICVELQSLLGDLAGVVGDIVSLAVPVDPGFLRVAVVELIVGGGPLAFNGLVNLLGKLPNSVLEILLNPSRLEDFIRTVLLSALPDGKGGLSGVGRGVERVLLGGLVYFVPIVGPFAGIFIETGGYLQIASATGIDFGEIKRFSDKYIAPHVAMIAKNLSLSVNIALLALFAGTQQCLANSGNVATDQFQTHALAPPR